MDLDDLLEQFGVGSAAGRGPAVMGEPAVERRGRNTEYLQHRVDTEPLAESADGFHHLFLVGSIS